MYYKRLVLLVSFLICTKLLIGQKGYELGIWLGGAAYYGDLNTSLVPRKPNLAGGILGRRNFNSRVSLKTSLNFARIAGDDALSDNTFEKNRNLSFRSNIFDLTSGIEFNFYEYVHGSDDAWFTPYLIGGISVFSYNPQAKLGNNWYSLRDFGTEGQDLGGEYGRVSAGFTIGGGFKWDINRDYSFNIEFTTRRLFTDYIDDVSTVYTDQASILNRRGPTAAALADRSLIDGIGVPGRQRGNSKDNDKYIFVGLAFVKYFGGIECPRISKIE